MIAEGVINNFLRYAALPRLKSGDLLDQTKNLLIHNCD